MWGKSVFFFLMMILMIWGGVGEQAEKEIQKKQKAQNFSAGKAKGKVTKNAKRWG